MTADTPRYAQIFDTLSKRVQTGLYPIDMRLPTESELCDEFNASRFTIREALGLEVPPSRRLAAAKAAFARAEIMRASRGFRGGQAARRSTEVRPRLGLMTRPCGLRYSLRWPSRSSFAKRFSFALEAKCSLTLPFFLIIT